jgi:hypothetical protein
MSLLLSAEPSNRHPPALDQPLRAGVCATSTIHIDNGAYVSICWDTIRIAITLPPLTSSLNGITFCPDTRQLRTPTKPYHRGWTQIGTRLLLLANEARH